MAKLSIFRIEDAGIEDTDALRVELFLGTDPEDATVAFNTVVFKNSLSLLYARLERKLKDNDEWEADANFSDCLTVTGDAKRIAVPRPFYRFERNKKGVYVKATPERNKKGVYVKATPERIVKYAKMVEIQGGPTFQEQMDRYMANVPDDCWIEEEENKED